MPATLNSLLTERRFALDLVAGDGSPALETPLSWAHSSDLADPTPWLEPGQLLLTDGTQFTADREHGFARAYVDRLLGAGIPALGFAVGVVHATIPDELVAAAQERAMPLVAVPASTPFIGLIRHVADVIAGERTARLEWSLSAQRAVARAAVRVDGLSAILLELAQRLECWVALYDSAGQALHVRGLDPVPPAIAPRVEEAVGEALRRGRRSGAMIEDTRGRVTLQTLGGRDRLLGVLAVGTGSPLDPAGTDLVASVIALASIALEQRRALDAARRRLRTGLLELLISGVVDVADRTATTLWGPLPPEPVRVTVVVGAVEGQSLLDELELHAAHRPGGLFFAERGDDLLVITGRQDQDELRSILHRHGLGGGVSAPVLWRELDRGITEAHQAAREVTGERMIRVYDDVTREGVRGLLLAAGGRDLARRRLQPVLDREPAERDLLLRTARVWLDRNCVWDAAARELGVHRHTLRSRIDSLGTLLGVDLERFDSRAELWTELSMLDSPATHDGHGTTPA